MAVVYWWAIYCLLLSVGPWPGLSKRRLKKVVANFTDTVSTIPVSVSTVWTVALQLMKTPKWWNLLLNCHLFFVIIGQCIQRMFSLILNCTSTVLTICDSNYFDITLHAIPFTKIKSITRDQQKPWLEVVSDSFSDVWGSY